MVGITFCWLAPVGSPVPGYTERWWWLGWPGMVLATALRLTTSNASRASGTQLIGPAETGGRMKYGSEFNAWSSKFMEHVSVLSLLCRIFFLFFLRMKIEHWVFIIKIFNFNFMCGIKWYYGFIFWNKKSYGCYQILINDKTAWETCVNTIL